MTRRSPETPSGTPRENQEAVNPTLTSPIPCPASIKDHAEFKRYKESLAGANGQESRNKWTSFHDYIPKMREIFIETGVPQDLLYIIFVESECNIMASSDGTKGPFQIKESTAEKWGLKVVTGVIDERLDPFKAAKTAALELRDMYLKFSNCTYPQHRWGWAMVAYNIGEHAAEKEYKQHGTRLDQYLPETTYVHRFYGSREVLKDLPLETPVTPKATPIIYKEQYQQAPKTHTVKKGENITGIAKQFESVTTLEKIVAYNLKRNPRFNPNELQIGDNVFVPVMANAQIDFTGIPNAIGLNSQETAKFKLLNRHLLTNVTTGSRKLPETTIYFDQSSQRDKFYETYNSFILQRSDAIKEDQKNIDRFVRTDQLLS